MEDIVLEPGSVGIVNRQCHLWTGSYVSAHPTWPTLREASWTFFKLLFQLFSSRGVVCSSRVLASRALIPPTRRARGRRAVVPHAAVMIPVTSARDQHPHHPLRRPIPKSHAESRTLRLARAWAHTNHGTSRATWSVVTYSASKSFV
jgi:hypothetical protein